MPKDRAIHKDGDQRVAQLVSLFTNILMKDGKKAKAHNLLTHALAHICWKTGLSFQQIVHSLREQMSPLFGLRSLRVGGSTIQVPFLLPQHTADAQGFRWLLQGAQRRRGKLRVSRKPSLRIAAYGAKAHTGPSAYPVVHKHQRTASFSDCLVAEMEETLSGQGFATAQRKDRHKRALANRQYSHYAHW